MRKYVNHPRLATANKLFYAGEWSAQQNSPEKSISPFRQKALHFIKRWPLKTQEHMPVASMGVSTMPMLGGCATHITSGSVMAKICLLRLGIETEEVNAENAIAQSTEKAAGRCAKAITAKGGVPLCALFALRPLVDAAVSAERYIRTTFTTFITLAITQKISRLAKPSKVLAPKPSQRKSQSAFFYARIAIG